MPEPRETNRRAWDQRARQQLAHAQPATEEDFRNPWPIVDDCGWLEGRVAGRRVLCLAAGGGKHGVLFASVGAHVTVVDLSAGMLDLDRQAAARRGLKLNTVEASMDDLSALPGAAFDVVIQPVSTCYVPDLAVVYREVARVTAADGLYIAQHKQPAALQADAAPGAHGYVMREPYYRTGPLPALLGEHGHRESGMVEFLHRWDELIGVLCRSGFVVEDLVEPRHGRAHAETGSFAHRSFYLPPFVTIKARRTRQAGEGACSRLIVPA